MDVSQLKSLLDSLLKKAEQIDQTRGKHYQPLFDEWLFSTDSSLLSPCVEETRHLLDTFVQEKEDDCLTTDQAEYLTEKLLAQITAIQKELSTQAIRSNEIRHGSHFKRPINLLYQDLAQHQEWERRLKELVRQKEKELDQVPSNMRQQALKALIAAEKRLERCAEATQKIEKQIVRREKNQ